MSHVAQSDPQRAGTAKRGVWKAQCLYIYINYIHMFLRLCHKSNIFRERENTVDSFSRSAKRSI